MTDVSIVLRDLESFNNEIKVAARKVSHAILSRSRYSCAAKSQISLVYNIPILVFRLNEEFHSSNKTPS